ncbi:hypothetical protein JI752_015725 [Lysobacter sp. MMG2]|uniref:hypothetical protein n=1 Tax=Lysobacter sp. MMG2 TaxID=2801338 RepID=UPI001C21F1E5|nr:hypothetical protein [Lysobacter sp. MMG2]MBU8977599.1 hypothetical protein [Lysobacter sp. MMG2]
MSTASARTVGTDRPLVDEERAVLRWLLTHGTRDNAVYLRQLDAARVVGHCGCGCASVDVAVDGRRAPEGRMIVLAQFQWCTREGHSCVAIVFEQGGLLAGLDLWSLDGRTVPSELPPIDALVPMDAPG